MHTKTKAHLAVLSANLIFAINFSTVKFITPSLVKPFALNVLRVAVTSVLLWLIFFINRPEKKIARKDFSRLVLCALTGVTINQLLFIKGLSMTYSTHASLLILCTPILITITAFFVLKEKLSWIRVTGLITGIGGAAWLITSRENKGGGSDILLGDLLVVLNAVSYSFYFVLAKPLLLKYSSLQILRWVFTIGSFFIIPIGWQEFTEISWSSFTTVHYAALIFVVLGATLMAYLLNIYGLQFLNASSTGAYIYLQPLFASLIAVLFLNEPLTTDKIISAVLIFTGVFLVNRRPMYEK